MINKIQYKEYLLSRHWKKFKIKYFKRYWQVCAICGSDKKINLHHRRYDNLCRETFDDVIPLCKKHHRDLHKYASTTNTKINNATNNFLISLKIPLNNHRNFHK